MLTLADCIRQSKPLPVDRRHRGAKFGPVALISSGCLRSSITPGLSRSKLAFAVLGKRLHVEVRNAA